MSLTTDQKATAAYKKDKGVADTNTNKRFFEEPVGGRVSLASKTWAEDSLIPTTAPTLEDGEVTGVVKKFVDLVLTPVPGSPDSFYHEDLKDAIPFNWGDGSYAYVIKNNGGTILPAGYNDVEVDNGSGILRFYGGAPLNMPPKITFYKYVGKFGAGGGIDYESFDFVDIDSDYEAYGFVTRPYPFRVVDVVDTRGTSTLILRSIESVESKVFGEGVGVDFGAEAVDYASVSSFEVEVGFVLLSLDTQYFAHVHCGNTNNGFFISLGVFRNGAETAGLLIWSTMGSFSSFTPYLELGVLYKFKVRYDFTQGHVYAYLDGEELDTSSSDYDLPNTFDPSMNPVYRDLIGFSLGNSGNIGFSTEYYGAIMSASLSVSDLDTVKVESSNLSNNLVPDGPSGVLTGTLSEGPVFHNVEETPYDGEIVQPTGSLKVIGDTELMSTLITLEHD